MLHKFTVKQSPILNCSKNLLLKLFVGCPLNESFRATLSISLKTTRSRTRALCALFKISSKRYIQHFLKTVFIFAAVLILSKETHVNHSSCNVSLSLFLSCSRSLSLSVVFYIKYPLFLPAMNYDPCLSVMADRNNADKQQILSYRLAT